MTPLSAHFSLEEAIASQTASRLGINNDPPLEVFQAMKKAALSLELIRMELNSNAIHVSSWYRCPELNKAVGSKPTSDHLTGFAIDFTCPTYGNVDAVIRAILRSKVPFKQVIREFANNGAGWVHVAFNGDQRQALIIDDQSTRAYA